MLYLVFHLGTERYILPAAAIVEMLPMVDTRAVPGSSPALVGVFNYRGQLVPLWDLSQLVLGQATQDWLSSRIVLVRDEKRGHLTGLLAERATETLQLDAAELLDNGDNWEKAPYLGPVVMSQGSDIQVILLDRLLEACRSQASNLQGTALQEGFLTETVAP